MEVNELSLIGRGELVQTRRGIMKQLDRELFFVAAKAELAQANEIAQAETTAVALTNLDALATLAEPIARAHPAFANEAAMLVRNYAAGASIRLNGTR